MKNNSIPVDANRIIRFLSKNRRSISPLLILTHDYPDPDALGSAFALQQIAKKIYGINSKIVYKGEIGRMENKAMVKVLKIPTFKIRPNDFKKYRHVALVDTQPAFKNNPFPQNRQATIVIDQHSSIKDHSSRLSVINTDCGATSVLLAQVGIKLRLKFPPELATALVYGILTDTLNLYRSSRSQVVEIYLTLLSYCNLQSLSKIQNPVRSKETYTTLGKGIENAMVTDRLIISHLGKIKSPDLISQVADFLLRYENMNGCLCTGQYGGKLYLSLRTANQKKDAGSILRSIMDDPSQAGGHGTIAGGSIGVGARKNKDQFGKLQNKLVRRLFKRLNLNGNKRSLKPFKWK